MRLIIGAFVGIAAIVFGAEARAASDSDIAAAQTVIRAQERAFARDDVAAAYAFAAPGIQTIWPTPQLFMEMVRSRYAPVYRHRSFEFGMARVVEGKIFQDVAITDAEGGAWDALYTLEPQADGSLKISACILIKAVTS